ncbi:MARCH1_8 [Acanthosepion pharaonis]|uniref:MARCH1_8 n=1 Tax=Acanthosepion pharaonis TaxID=158019 RepID=A0A812BM71_ACAPH|nr:MARCH1_8 [Sepia pharaonis]
MSGVDSHVPTFASVQVEWNCLHAPRCKHLSASTSLKVPLRRHLSASTSSLVPLCKYLFASTSWQVPLRKYLSASTSLEAPLRKYLFASTSPQAPLCKYLFASASSQVPLRKWAEDFFLIRTMSANGQLHRHRFEMSTFFLTPAFFQFACHPARILISLSMYIHL